MKIVQIITTLGYGGAEKLCLELSNGLAGREEVEKVYLVSLFDQNETFRPQTAISPEITYITLGKKTGWDFSVINRVHRELERIRPDILHTHLTGLLASARYILGKHRPATIHTVHNVASKDVNKLFQQVHKYLFRRRLALPVAISPEIRESVSAYYKLQEVPLIENFTAPPQSRPGGTAAVREEIAQYRKNKDTRVFLNIARINPQKNQQMLIEAFSALQEENVVLLIAGGADQRFTGLKQELEQAAGKTGNVFLLGNKPDIGDYLRCSDAFILSSVYEGLPISLLEALATGVIPVCTPVGGIPSIVKHHETGFLCGGISKEEIKSAIRDFLHTPEAQLENMRIQGQKLFEERYSVEAGVNSYLNLYKQCRDRER